MPAEASDDERTRAIMVWFGHVYYGCRGSRDFLTKLGHRVRTVGRCGQDITLALVDEPPDRPPT